MLDITKPIKRVTYNGQEWTIAGGEAVGLLEGTLTKYNDEYGAISQIRSYAFYSNSVIQSVNFPTVMSIGSSAFYNCSNLASINFPNCSVIHSNAFNYCSALVTANFPDCMTMGSSIFANCLKLETVSLPLCSIINDYAFGFCRMLTNVSFPSCEIVKNNAFQNCAALTSANFPQATLIDDSAFMGCSNLTNVNIPNCIELGGYVFSGCSLLTSISLLNVKDVGDGAFLGAGITELYLPNFGRGFSARTLPYNVERVDLPICRGGTSYAFLTSVATEFSLPACITLASYAFYGASQLQSLSLPNCTWFRSGNIFYGCQSLSALYLNRKCVLDYTNTFTSTPFGNSTYLGYFGSIYVRQRDLSWYQSATNWAAYSSRITTYEPEEDLLDEVDNYMTSTRSLTTQIENCNIGDNLIAGVYSVGTVSVSEGWTLISSIDNITSASNSYKMYVYTKVATSTSETITVTQSTSGRLYTEIVNVKNKTLNLVDELNYMENIAINQNVVITKPNSKEMLIFIGCAASLTYSAGYALRGDFDREYVCGQQGRFILIHNTKTQGSQMEFEFYPTYGSGLAIIGIELT